MHGPAAVEPAAIGIDQPGYPRDNRGPTGALNPPRAANCPLPARGTHDSFSTRTTMLDLLKRLPIRDLTDLQLWFRNTFATKRWPEDVEYVPTLDPVEWADATLQDEHFEDASGYSLQYRGEVLSLRRPDGADPDGTPMEIHLRAREHPSQPDVLQWIAHREANRFTAKYEHVHEGHLEWLPTPRVRSILEEGDVTTAAVHDPI